MHEIISKRMKHIHTFESFLNEALVIPKDASRVVQDLFNKKKYVEITADTKLEEYDEILGIYNGMFYTIRKVSGDVITIADDSFGDKEKISRDELATQFIIKKK
jgi:hypothetical protein